MGLDFFLKGFITLAVLSSPASTGDISSTFKGSVDVFVKVRYFHLSGLLFSSPILF